MPLDFTWYDVAIRLALSSLAGAFIGLNRGERGQPAGLRTVMLVCVAAAMSMIQANYLLATSGKAADSFVSIDVMRLPLGVLSGMGFIGAGAILRRSDLVLGVTTAATLWYVTIMGLCFGGGQVGLGLAMLAVGMFVLWILKRFEDWLKHDHHVRLRVTTTAEGPEEAALRELLGSAGLRVQSCAVLYDARRARRVLLCRLRWRCRGAEVATPPVVKELAEWPGVVVVDWRP